MLAHRNLALIFGLLSLSASCTQKSKEPPNTFHFIHISKIKGLDPIQTDDVYASVESARGYEGLLQYHYLKRPFTLIPNLAESMPEVSADGKTITFKLKKGVLFQDDPSFKETGGKGREFIADDVVYSWKRLADPKNAAPSFWLIDGKVEGINEWREEAIKSGSTDYSKPVEGFKALDRYTVQVKLKQRAVQFLYGVAMSQMFVVPREAVEYYGREFTTKAVGTGPFKLESYNPATKIVWVKSPSYRKELYPSEGEPEDKERGLLEDAGKALPLADRIVTHLIEEAQPRWLNFLKGGIDFVDVPKDNYAQVIGPNKELVPDLSAKGVKLWKVVRLDTTHVGFNMADPVIGKNKLLRQALSLAYDSDLYIKIFYNGRAIPAQGPIPPGLSGYDPALKNPYRQFNLAKAKDLLAKAGYPEGKGLAPLELNVPSSSTDRQDAEFLAQSFGALGVKVNPVMATWPEFSQRVKNKKGQLFIMGWQGDYPDAENFMQLFYGKNVSPGSNGANYSNPEFDRMYEKALTLPDAPERTELYRKMVALLIEDAPWIFNSHRVVYTLTQPWTKNLKPNELDAGRSKYIRIDAAVKADKKR